jgi:hypothetical protein
MTVISTPGLQPARILSTLTDSTPSGGKAPVIPTERWDGRWNPSLVTDLPNVYGLYVRSVPLSKWLDREVRDLLERYPGEVGTGTMPSGLKSCTIANTAGNSMLGDWVLLYVGISDSKTPRINQYFGRTPHFTREPGGQSLHLTLSLFFGGGSDPRDALDPRAATLENVLRGSLSVRMESRMRDMRLSYVQVVTPVCSDGFHQACTCNAASEWALLRDPAKHSRWTPNGGWAASFGGARPLFNAEW